MKSVQQGASTSVWAAVSEDLEAKGGLYLDDCGISTEGSDPEVINENLYGYMPYVMNQESANKLWHLSEELIKKD